MLKNDVRYIVKRIILALALAFIFFFLKSNNVLAASITPNSAVAVPRYAQLKNSDNYGVAQYFDSWGTWSSAINVGQTAAYNTDFNPAELTQIGFRAGYNSKFQAGNTYTFVVKVELNNSSYIDLIGDNFEVWACTAGDVTNSLSPDNISSYSFTFRKDSSSSTSFVLTVTATVQKNSTYVAFYYRDKRINKVYPSAYWLKNTSVKLSTFTISFSESSNSYIEQCKIAIQTLTTQIFHSSNREYEYLTDDSDADIDVSGMSGITGILPAGPVDSLLSLPLTLINILIDSSSGSCTPFTFTFVFDEQFSLPCFDSFWSQVPAQLLLFISDVPAVYLFVLWAKSVYKRVEKAMTFETSIDDEWGGV